MTKAKTLEIRGKNRAEIIDYFCGLGGTDTGEERFCFPGWEAAVGSEGVHAVRGLRFPSVKVVFSGEPALVEKAIWAFRIRFLSAGG